MRHLGSSVESALERFRRALDVRFGSRVREVVLFGSRARGEAHEESDADVLVVIDDLSERERRVVFDAAYDAGATDDDYLSISPLPYSSEQAAELQSRGRRLFRDIARDGIPVIRGTLLPQVAK